MSKNKYDSTSDDMDALGYILMAIVITILLCAILSGLVFLPLV